MVPPVVITTRRAASGCAVAGIDRARHGLQADQGTKNVLFIGRRLQNLRPARSAGVLLAWGVAAVRYRRVTRPRPRSGVDGPGAGAQSCQHRNAKQNMTPARRHCLPIASRGPEAPGGPFQRGPVHPEVRDGHLAAAMKAAMRVKNPTAISRPQTNSISPAHRPARRRPRWHSPIGQSNSLSCRASRTADQTRCGRCSTRGGVACKARVQVGGHGFDPNAHLGRAR